MDNSKDSVINQATAAELRGERAAANLTLEELVEATGLSLSTLRRIFRGDTDIDVTHLVTLAGAFGTTAEILFARASSRAAAVMSQAAGSNVVSFPARPDTAAEIDNYAGRKAAYRDNEADHDEHYD
ncbi:helix-turn-helix domain-containing protein [Mycetocola saprophilus]|uniref:helix-turn-helix domain-containing protein n=1 Tax=Mycetocola saprophilus TaxID=76636 RepID=UPI003BF21837